MAKKNNNVTERIGEKSTLTVRNYGDVVVIKNRSAVGGGVFGALIMVFTVAVVLNMKEAWSSPAFWGIFAFLFLCSAYWFANAVFGKIILDSPKKTMTVYGPFKKEYGFGDVNYVETVSAKPKDGHQVHTVYVYIGNGRRNVRIDTLSSQQAKEVETLLKGMLDSGAIEYPEDVTPTATPEKKRTKGALFDRLNRKENKQEETKSVALSEDEQVSFVTKATATPEKAESSEPTAYKDSELDQYEAYLIRRNKK